MDTLTGLLWLAGIVMASAIASCLNNLAIYVRNSKNEIAKRTAWEFNENQQRMEWERIERERTALAKSEEIFFEKCRQFEEYKTRMTANFKLVETQAKPKRVRKPKTS